MHRKSLPFTGLNHAYVLGFLIWFLMGLGIVLNTTTSSDILFHTQLPFWFRVLSWWGPAALCITSMFTRRFGSFTVAMLMLAPVLRIASFMIGWFIYVVNSTGIFEKLPFHLESEGYPSGWYAALLHVLHVGFVILLALLVREDREVREHLRDGE